MAGDEVLALACPLACLACLVTRRLILFPDPLVPDFLLLPTPLHTDQLHKIAAMESPHASTAVGCMRLSHLTEQVLDTIQARIRMLLKTSMSKRLCPTGMYVNRFLGHQKD